MANLRREERLGLTLAVALHAMLLGLLALRPSANPAPVPQAIRVTLAPNVGLNAAAPSREDAAADVAPTLGTPRPPAPAAVPAAAAAPAPAQVEQPPLAPVPAPKPVTVTHLRPVTMTRPKPVLVKPPEPDAIAPLPAKPAHKSRVAAKTDASVKRLSVKDWDLTAPASDNRPAGASRIGNDFLKGVAGGKTSGKARQQGAAVIGPQLKSSLSGAIARQLKPHWQAPQGVDADKLVTVLAWDLNRDGTLAGEPRVVRQDGISDSNRPQAARHAEQAIRAVELAAPFQLPPQYYALWKHVLSFEFNRTLSQ